MKISFFLARPHDDKETAIYARFSYSGNNIKFYTNESIHPKFWNKQQQRVRETQKFPEYPEFNVRLDKIATQIKDVFRKYQNTHGCEPMPEVLKELLAAEINKKVSEKETIKTFFAFFEYFIQQSKDGLRLQHRTGKPISKNTIKSYVTVYNHLLTFQASQKKKIDFAAIDLDFYESYKEYLIKNCNASTNSIGKHIQIVKTVMNEATEIGINTNLAFESKRFRTLTEQSDSIYLQEREIDELEILDLSANERLERARDLFLIGCYTGLRYSDYSILRPEQIVNGFINTTQTKTGKPVAIPVHTKVEKILSKYQGKLPRPISNQKTNEYLKEIAKQIPLLHAITTKTITQGGVTIHRNLPKYELLTTHTARRSFATNEYLAGTPALTIMAITGHRTETAFLKYIKLNANDHAQILKQYWDKRAQLKIV